MAGLFDSWWPKVEPNESSEFEDEIFSVVPGYSPISSGSSGSLVPDWITQITLYPKFLYLFDYSLRSVF